MTKKKLTILIDWYLPGTKAGGPVRSIFSLIALLKDDFEIRVITSNCDLGTTTPYPNITANKWLEKEGVHYFYFSKENLTKPNLKQLLLQIKSDVIYINSFWSYWFSIYIVQLKNTGIINSAIVLAPRGMLGKGALTLKPAKKRIYLLASKLKKFYKHIHFHATNAQEVNDIQRVFKKAQITTISNVNHAMVTTIQKQKKEGELRLFYLSRISPIKNLHFALEILKEIPTNYSISYSIYGNIEDAVYWKKCEQIISELPAHINVIYKSELAFDEIQEKICKHHFLFLPTQNENFGHSIVESLFSGCPAIISNQTPWHDLPKTNAGYVLDLQDKLLWVKTIINCAAMDNTSYQKISKNAQYYISEKINLPLIKQNYTQLFNAAR